MKSPRQSCKIPPPGWLCTREGGHEGPCAAIPDETPPPPAPIQRSCNCGKEETGCAAMILAALLGLAAILFAIK